MFDFFTFGRRCSKSSSLKSTVSKSLLRIIFAFSIPALTANCWAGVSISISVSCKPYESFVPLPWEYSQAITKQKKFLYKKILLYFRMLNFLANIAKQVPASECIKNTKSISPLIGFSVWNGSSISPNKTSKPIKPKHWKIKSNWTIEWDFLCFVIQNNITKLTLQLSLKSWSFR